MRSIEAARGERWMNKPIGTRTWVQGEVLRNLTTAYEKNDEINLEEVISVQKMETSMKNWS